MAQLKVYEIKGNTKVKRIIEDTRSANTWITSWKKCTSYHLYAVLKIAKKKPLTQPMLQLKRRMKTYKENCLSYQLAVVAAVKLAAAAAAAAAAALTMNGNMSEKEL